MSPALQPSQPEGSASTPLQDHDTASVLVRLHAEILRHERFDAAALSFVSKLADEARFDRVSLGLLRRHYTEVIAVSHDASEQKQTPRTRELTAVMDEAIEQSLTVCFPAARGADSITLAHAAFGR